MNLSKKLLLGALTTGILVSPLAGNQNQANASEQPQTLNQEVAKEVQQNVDTTNLKVGDNIQFQYSIKGDRILKPQTVKRDFGPGPTLIHSKNAIPLKNYVSEEDSKIDPNKTYKFKINAHIVSTGHMFGGKKTAAFTTTEESFTYLGSN
ncbi:hypothetical protein [Mammaliicoccus vitulinus]|uniref:hypothetical protein n=1 Tax=Mammaliicoccus vitulinus TaxID=71237 RepID=UPI003BA04910